MGSVTRARSRSSSPTAPMFGLRIERMGRYLARPPIATDRLSQLEDGRLDLQLKRPWRDGMTYSQCPPVQKEDCRGLREIALGDASSSRRSVGASRTNQRVRPTPPPSAGLSRPFSIQ